MRPLALAVATFLACAQPMCAQAPFLPFEEKLREVRSDLQVDHGRFAGRAAPVLESAIADARHVLVGEDHMTREIPEFTQAVCNVMARKGLSAVAVETGPQVAQLV